MASNYRTGQEKLRDKFEKASRTEQSYRRSLNQVARQVGAIVKGFAPEGKVQNLDDLTHALKQYSQMLRPWAKSVAQRMLAEVNQKEERAWKRLSSRMGRSLARDFGGQAIAQVLIQRLAEQVELITSLPTEAAERVHKLTLEAITTGRRAEDIAKEIAASGEVTMSRAKTIARTEVARTSSLLTQSRAESVGSTHYIWRTVGDSDVRHSHQEMDGTVQAWASPPTLSDGTTTHPGQIYNCRCYAEPILPED